jgi:hypothetical protein
VRCFRIGEGADVRPAGANLNHVGIEGDQGILFNPVGERRNPGLLTEQLLDAGTVIADRTGQAGDAVGSAIGEVAASAITDDRHLARGTDRVNGGLDVGERRRFLDLLLDP